MKEATAKLKYARLSPRKVRLITDMIRGLPVQEAEAQLELSPKRASSLIMKLVRGVVANAKNNKLAEGKLYIKEIKVDGGPTLKRWMPRARGSASPVNKRTSHITIVLGESEKIRQPNYIFIKEEKKKEKEPTKKTEKQRRKEEKRAGKELEVKKSEKTGGEKRRFFRRKSV